jgi:hypothetical protein
MPIAVDDHPGADSTHLPFIAARLPRLPEEISEKRVIFKGEHWDMLYTLSDLNVHDRRHGLLGHIGNGCGQVERPVLLNLRLLSI